MRIAEYKPVGYTVKTRKVIIPAQFDNNGVMISDEVISTIDVQIPSYGLEYRDMTAEEEVAHAAEELPVQEPTDAERIEAQVLYTAVMTDTLLEE